MHTIVCRNEELLPAVKIVEGIIEKKQQLPILSNFLVKQEGRDVMLYATDLDMQIKTSANIGVEGVSNEFTVTANKIAQVLSKLPQQTAVTLDLNPEKDELILLTDSSKYIIKTLPAKDYPILKHAEWKRNFKISARELHHLLHMCNFAMPAQETRFYLIGMLFVYQGGMVRTVATDTHRLAYYEMEIDKAQCSNPDEAFDAIIPRKTIRELLRLLPEDDTMVTISFSDMQVCFEYGNVTFMSKLVEGRFPDYRRVLPSRETHVRSLLLNREALIQALGRVGIMTSDKFNGVRWILSNNELQIQSINNNNEEANESLHVEWPYDALDMGFNITYLQEVLNVLKSKDVEFNFVAANNSVLITIPDQGDHFRYVVMPMRL